MYITITWTALSFKLVFKAAPRRKEDTYGSVVGLFIRRYDIHVPAAELQTAYRHIELKSGASVQGLLLPVVGELVEL